MAELTNKEKRFIEEYCVDFNKTQAAIRAGYSVKSAAMIGHVKYRKVEIFDEINRRLDEFSMTSNEAVKRLTDWGRGSFLPFVVQDAQKGIVLDLSRESALENIHLVRKVKQTKRVLGGGDEDSGYVEYSTEIELHDAKDAVDKILKIRGMYVERTEAKITAEVKTVQVQLVPVPVLVANNEKDVTT
jgi:phage terminase small subunit